MFADILPSVDVKGHELKTPLHIAAGKLNKRRFKANFTFDMEKHVCEVAYADVILCCRKTSSRNRKIPLGCEFKPLIVLNFDGAK